MEISKKMYQQATLLQLDADNWTWLKAHAREQGMSGVEIIRRLIELYKDASELELKNKLGQADWRLGVLKSVRY